MSKLHNSLAVISYNCRKLIFEGEGRKACSPRSTKRACWAGNQSYSRSNLLNSPPTSIKSRRVATVYIVVKLRAASEVMVEFFSVFNETRVAYTTRHDTIRQETLKPFETHCCHMDRAIKYYVPDWVKPSCVIFDIRALWRSGLSARVPECQKLQMTA